MSASNDPGHFFQTDASEATRARRAAKAGNKNGDPLKLQSKLLAAIPDPASTTSIYVSESAGCVRKVNIETKDKATVYRGPVAPVTSVAIGGKNGDTIFAGCWDKDVWSWDRESREVKRKFKGHSDFVKAVICTRIEDQEILISGGADAKIIVWNASTGERLHTLRDKTDTMMAIQFLAIDPLLSTASEAVLLSSSSDPNIRQWRISLSAASQILEADLDNETTPAKRATILEHETSVYSLQFTEDDEGDLWTASADGTAKCLSRARNWEAEETLVHGDYVRAVAVTDAWVITAGRDEDVKVWDRNTGKLFHIFDGHYEEITGLVLVDGGKKCVSVGIDGTVRTWPLGRTDLMKAKEEAEEMKKGVVKEVVPEKKSLLTAEEEAELAELMDEE